MKKTKELYKLIEDAVFKLSFGKRAIKNILNTVNCEQWSKVNSFDWNNWQCVDKLSQHDYNYVMQKINHNYLPECMTFKINEVFCLIHLLDTDYILVISIHCKNLLKILSNI